MSVTDEAVWPRLRLGKQFVREAITRWVAVLGVCQGAQLIASALGARVVAYSSEKGPSIPVEISHLFRCAGPPDPVQVIIEQAGAQREPPLCVSRLDDSRLTPP